jgi:hypothetical protein
VLDPSNQHIANLIPESGVNVRSCKPSKNCVELLDEDPSMPGATPTHRCYMAALSNVATRPAASTSFQNIVYFADQGSLFAYDSSTQGTCASLATAPIPDGPVLLGPVVLAGQGGSQDEIYLVASNWGSNVLLHYTYSSGAFSSAPMTPLVFPNAVGLAMENSAIPSRMVVTFSGGQIVLLSSSTGVIATNPGLPPGTNLSAPYWCHCPGPTDLIGVGNPINGQLYVLNVLSTAMTLRWTYPTPAAGIHTAPATDTAGDWFIGADDGLLYEVQPNGTFGARFGYLNLMQVGSSPVFAPCQTGHCIYFAKRDGTAYVVPLVDRIVQMSACIGTVGTCSGVNPRLWVQVRISSSTYPGNTPQTVHVQGWSYYSP